MLYCVQVRAGGELSVLESCKCYMDESSYDEIFVPQYEIRKRYQGKWHDVYKILFAGYVFFASDAPEKLFSELKKVPHMTKLLKTGDDYRAVLPEEEKFLRTMMDEDYIIRVSEGLIIGDEVWIAESGLSEYRAAITKIDRHRRIAKLEIDMFGHPTPAEVGLEVIHKVTEDEFETWKRSVLIQKNVSDYDPSIPYGKVEKGVFKGMIGEIVLRADDGYRMRIELYGRKTIVDFDRDEIVEIR